MTSVNTAFSVILVTLGLAAAAGCGDDDGTPMADAPVAVPDAGGLPCTDEPCLDPPAPPASGFQLRSVGTIIQPGEDVEYCEVLVLPGTPADTWYVTGFDVAMTTSSHHLIVSAIEVGTATETGATIGERRECLGANVFGEDLEPVTGSQHPTKSEHFPPGIGRVYQGGQKVVFDYHYFNTTDEPLQARAAVNFYTAEAADVTNIARGFGFYHLGINTPPMESASFRGECTFDQDVIVYKLTRHTHKWGTDFSAWWAGGADDGALVFTSSSYEDTDFEFAQPVTIPAGQGFEFECNYTNDTTAPLVFGPNATDEMCILFGVWWTPDPATAAADQSCVIF